MPLCVVPFQVSVAVIVLGNASELSVWMLACTIGSTATLRVVAEHADLWNMPGGDIDDAVRRSAMLDRFCTEIGRDPASITRSIILPVSYDHPGNTRKAIAEAIDAGFPHIILSLPAPYPEKVAQWVTDELINESA